jgi:hypothetical protein
VPSTCLSAIAGRRREWPAFFPVRYG